MNLTKAAEPIMGSGLGWAEGAMCWTEPGPPAAGEQ